MDPRCYFSTTWYRYAKQSAIDALKQRARRRLLAERPGRPFIDPDALLGHYADLLRALAELHTTVHVLGLIGPDRTTFPGSAEHFAVLNDRLKALASQQAVDFIDWGSEVASRTDGAAWRYRDGFHPNAAGARLLGTIIRERMAGAR